MRHADQHNAFGASELRVEPEHLDREVDLVDDALAGSVAAAKQFEILDSIILSVPVDVVDGFGVKKFAAEMSRHDVSVFQHFGLFSAVSQCGHRNPDVAISLDVSAKLSTVESVESLGFLRRIFAFDAAVLLRAVNLSSFARAVHYFTTLRTCEFVSFVGRFSLSGIRAVHGAVQWIATELFSVCGQIGLHHDERFAALFAREVHRCSAGSRKSLLEPVSTSAGQATVFSPCCGIARVAVKRLLAALARHLDRHGFVLLFGDGNSVNRVVRDCQVALL